MNDRLNCWIVAVVVNIYLHLLVVLLSAEQERLDLLVLDLQRDPIHPHHFGEGDYLLLFRLKYQVLSSPTTTQLLVIFQLIFCFVCIGEIKEFYVDLLGELGAGHRLELQVHEVLLGALVAQIVVAVAYVRHDLLHLERVQRLSVVAVQGGRELLVDSLRNVKVVERFLPLLALEAQLTVDEVRVALRLELGARVTLGRLTQRVQMLGDLGRLAQSIEQVELLARIAVRLLLELHGVGPGALALKQRYEQELAVDELVDGDVALLEALLIAAHHVQRFAQAVQTARAIRTVALIVHVAQAVLLLCLFDHLKDLMRQHTHTHVLF